MSTGIRRSAPSRRRLLGTALVLGAALWVAACGGGRVDPPGPDTGVTRQFDEYPASLSIEGPGIVESGATLTLQARADNNEYRGPAYLTSSAAQTLRIAGSPTGLTTPASVLLEEDRADRNFLSGDFVVAAPSVTAATQFSVSVDNPRASAERVVTVVPAGTLYIRRLLLSRPVVEAGQSVTIEIELSQPAPVATEVRLAANFSRLELPASVTVPANERSVSVDVRAQESPGQEYVTVSATLDGLAQQASLWVRSAQAFVLKIELHRHYQAPHPDSSPAFATRQYIVPVRLSKPAPPGGLEVTFTSNNSFATLPASVLASPGLELMHVPFEVAAFVDSTGAQFSGLSAVRITVSGGGTTRIGDALLGRDEGTPVIESLTLHRLAGDGSGGFIEAAPCFNSNNRAHGIPIYGRANIVLDRSAPAGGFRINLFAQSSVFRLQQEFTVPAGTRAIGFEFEIPTGTAGEQLRFVKVTARSVETLQERSDTLLVGEGGGGLASEVTSGSGSLGQAGNHIPYFDWDPQPTAGGVLRGRVTLGEVDANGNFVEAHPHGADDVPVYLTLIESGAPEVSVRVPTATLTIPALLGYADFELPLPAGASRQVVLRADAYSTQRYFTGSGPPCDLSYVRTIDLGAGGTLASAVVTPRHVFRGEGGTVTVTLSEPAPATGAVVELTANAGPSFITLPAQVVVPAGATSASVPFGTTRVAGFLTVDVQARYGNSTNARVELMPEPEPLVLRFDPATLHYGSNASLRLELPDRYPVPLVATLRADAGSAALLSLPSTIVVPARQRSVPVPVAVRPSTDGERMPVRVSATLRVSSADAQGEIASILSWADLGPAVDSSELAQAPSVIFYGGKPSLAYVSTQIGEVGRLFVKSFDGTDWQTEGDGALNPASLTAAGEPSYTRDARGSRVLAFSQGNGAQQNVYAVTRPASDWLALGLPGTPLNVVAGSRAVSPKLVALGDRLGLGWIEDGVVRFALFDGASWIPASPPEASSGHARDLRIASHVGSDRTARVFLAWINELDPAEPVRMAYLDLSGGGWQMASRPPIPPAAAGNPRLTHLDLLSNGGFPVVVWSQGSNPATVLAQIYSYGSDTWTPRGSAIVSDVPGTLRGIATELGSSGMVVALGFDIDGASGSRVSVRRWEFGGSTATSGQWVEAAIDDLSPDRIEALAMTRHGSADTASIVVAGVFRSQAQAQAMAQLRVRRFR